jgi:hypothetical protein
MKIPSYVPFLGILISFALFIIVASIPNITFLIIGLILLHLSGWIFIVKFFLCGLGFFSSVLETK